MSAPSEDQSEDREARLQKILGLGERSIRKNYYPELQRRLNDLHASEERYRAVFNSANDAILILEPTHGTILDVNERGEELLGLPRQQILQSEMGDCGTGEPPFTRKEARGYIALTRAGLPQMFEWHVRRGNGELRWVEVSLRAARLGEETRLILVARDIEERRRGEAALRASEERLKRIVGVTTDLIYEWHVASGELVWHGESATIMGYPAVQAPRTLHAWLELIHPEDQERMQRSVDEHRTEITPLHETYRARDANGTWSWWENFATPILNAAGQPERWIGGCRDISRERTLEEQTRQSQKMEAIGQLTGGVAHDFNNLLQVINGYSELALRRYAAKQPIEDLLSQVLKAGERAARLIAQLLAFSRRQMIQPEVLDLNVTVEDLLKMLRRVIGEHIQVEWKPAPRLEPIRADRGMIEQVLINLCLNARDAMPDGGSLRIESEMVDIGSGFCATHTWASPGSFALLSVCDTGCGMEKATLERIFEPFFSTKEPGKGTGLGMSTVYGIVRQHEGMINVYSEVGQGTICKLYWPTCEGTKTVQNKVQPRPVKGGTETILLAEDEGQVREFARDILQEAGYTVVTASNGAEAVEIFGQHKDEIDLVLTDVVMPELGGPEAYARIRALAPRCRVVYASGYSEVALVATEEGPAGRAPLLQKPFSRDRLLEVVRTTLDAPPRPKR